MKICIENKDRHGLVYDISKILLKYNVNIISMEVIKNTTYLETEALSYKTEQKILSELHELSGIVQIKSIMLMPHNENTNKWILFSTPLMRVLSSPIKTEISSTSTKLL